MQLLASCSVEQAENFRGKLVLPDEDKKTPDKVLLNIVVEDGKSVFDRIKGSVECITYKGVSYIGEIPEKYEGKVFNLLSLEEYKALSKPLQGTAITLVQLDEATQPNLRELVGMCNDDLSLRFIGGNLLSVEGLRIGRYDKGKEKMLPVFKDIYDYFVEVDLNDLDGLQQIVRKTRKRAEGAGVKESKSAKKGTKSSKQKVSPKRVQAFNKLFFGEEDEF